MTNSKLLRYKASNVVSVFLMSAVVAVAASAALEIPLLSTATQISRLSVFAFIEEFLKFGAAYIVVLLMVVREKSKGNSRIPSPAMKLSYLVIAAIGFALSESAINFLIQDSLVTFVLGRTGSTAMHILTSSIVAYGWITRKLLVGLFVASLLHAGYNFLVFSMESTLVGNSVVAATFASVMVVLTTLVYMKIRQVASLNRF